MAEVRPSPLENRLLAQIERDLSLDRGQLVEICPEALVALRERLERTETSENERRAFDSAPDREIGFDAVVDLRIREAVDRARTLAANKVSRGTPTSPKSHLQPRDPEPKPDPKIFSSIEIDPEERKALESILRPLLSVDPPAESTPKSPQDPGEPLAADSSMIWEQPSLKGLEPGQILGGKYRILRPVGQGGFSSVYEAEDEVLGTRVAIKTLRVGSDDSLSNHESLIAEARRVTRLNHPNIVDWKAFEKRTDGSYYFVMELLGGEPLDQILKREKLLSPARTGRILLEVLDALRAAHHLSETESILHLDLKPHHVFLEKDPHGKRERVKVIDFGIGQYIGATEEEKEEEETSSNSGEGNAFGTVTQFGSLSLDLTREKSTERFQEKGPPGVRRCLACTPEYASPEQCSHLSGIDVLLPLDGRSDLYSLGVMGYQMLTGELPFSTPENRGEWLRIHRKVPPRPFSSFPVRIPRALQQFIERCLEKDRDRRFRDTEHAYETLESGLRPRAVRNAALLILTVTLILVVLLISLPPGSTPPPLSLFRNDVVLREGETLFFGPENRETRLRIVGWFGDLRTSRLRLLEAPRAQAPPIEGWDLSLTEATQELTLRMTAAESPTHTGFVELSAEGEPPLYSRAIQLTFLDPQSWSIRSADIEGRRGRAVNLEGQQLTVLLFTPDPDHIERVFLEQSDGTRSPAILRAHDPDASRGENLLIYDVDLTDTTRGSGVRDFSVIAVDRAGSRKRLERSVSIVSDALSLENLALDVPLHESRFYVHDWAQTTLRGELNRPAAVSWRVGLGSSEFRGAAMTTESREFSIPLAALAGLHSPSQGNLEITVDESAHVAYRDESRGRFRHDLPFFYSRENPELAVRLQWSNRHSVDLSPGSSVRVDSRELLFQIELLTQTVPTVLSLDCLRNGKEVFESQRTILDSPSIRSQATFPVSLLNEGHHHVVLRTAPYDPEARLPDLSTREYEIVVDTHPPRLRIERSAALETSKTGSLLLEDPTPADQDFPVPPITLSWNLEWLEEPPSPSIPLDLGLPRKTPPGRLDFTLPRLGDSERNGDGRYRLQVEARDGSGNRSRTSMVWTVSQEGPRLEMRVPESREWLSVERRWPLRIHATDYNGVQAVECKIHHSDKGVPPIQLDLTPETRETAPKSCLWKANFVFPPSWSKAQVELHFTGVDAHGHSEFLIEPRFLPVITDSLPSRLRLEPREIPVGSTQEMILVPGNTSLYMFGGRGDELESYDFRKAGIPSFNPKTARRSWQIEYPRGEIKEFYLDEYEVTRGEFLRFLKEPSGYRALVHRSRDADVNERRHRQLEADLSDPNRLALPVTEIDWEEALAYAQWTGKRLPSRVEWEFAFRAGHEYRPYPNHERSLPPKSLAELGINCVTISNDSSLWPPNAGGDRSREGIYNLAGNVREWTSTPYRFGQDPRHPRIEARERARELLDPRRFPGWEERSSYWIVGGCSLSRAFDFSVAQRGGRTQRRSDVGFRCALDARTVRELLAGQLPIPFRILESKAKTASETGIRGTIEKE